VSYLDKAKELTAKWLSLLGLTDWSVRVEVCDLGGNLGECCASWDYLEALIRYRDPAIHGPYDLEAVVAHEVCHLPFSMFETQAGTWERRAEENLVERFSRTMLSIVRGKPGLSTARLREELRAVVGASVRARRALNSRRNRMDPKLLELIMKAGEFTGRDDVPEDVKGVLAQLVAAAAGASAPPSGEGDEPPAAPDAPEEEPTAPPAAEEEPMPPQRAAVDAIAARAKRDAEEAARNAAEAKALSEQRLREELFASAPDVFPAAMPRAREAYKGAAPAEIKRHIAAVRARTDNGAPPPAPRAREAGQEPREPLPGTQPVNKGGMVVTAAGKKVIS
jgi:hypothetical protein